MHDKGLIGKLHAAGVIDKRINELKFSDEFCKHLVNHNKTHGFEGAGTIEVWSQILIDFSGSLTALSDKEVATTIVLLDYFLDKLTTGKS
jgi:hypothetical protein